MPIADPATRRSAADITREADITDRRSISLVPQERISLRGFASSNSGSLQKRAANR